MPRVVHIVVGRNFAGVERYVCDVAHETARHGWGVTVIGGHPRRTPAEVGEDVRWLPGGNLVEAARSVVRSGRHDVCHVHMTNAEALGVATRGLHRGRLVSTRHFAQRRGLTRAGRVLAPWIAHHLDVEVAISEHVADSVEVPPQAVIPSGVRNRRATWRAESRSVLVMQRLEPEKDTMTALRAWWHSGLADHGWTLRIVGDGSGRGELETVVRREGLAAVTFAGWSDRPAEELARAGLLLAPTPNEGLGLGVLEAMAAGVPVVVAAGGGHRELVGDLLGTVGFAPGSAEDAARTLGRVAGDTELRREVSRALRQRQRERFCLDRTVRQLQAVYEDASLPMPSGPSPLEDPHA